MKLNNKGMTTIEILLCFLLVVIITSVMYKTVSAFNELRIIEEYKSQIVTYKNTLTKTIQDDLIMEGLSEVKVTQSTYIGDPSKKQYTIVLTFQSGTLSVITIDRRYAKSSYHSMGSPTADDYYMIAYGKIPRGTLESEYNNDAIEFPLPDLGSYTNDNGQLIKDLSINNIYINDGKEDGSGVFTLHIGLYHPELGSRYAIDITCPVNYISSGSDATSGLNLY